MRSVEFPSGSGFPRVKGDSENSTQEPQQQIEDVPTTAEPVPVDATNNSHIKSE
jgi:hypothetical protein